MDEVKETLINLDTSGMTWGDLEDLEKATSMRELIVVIDRFLVPPQKARDLPLRALKQVKSALTKAMQSATDEKN